MLRLAVILVLGALLASPALACEALLLARNTPANSMDYQQGDVIAIKPDGFTGWGANEGLPIFWKLRVTGATVVDCQAYMEQLFDANGEQTSLRKKRLSYNSLSTPQKRSLDDTGILTVTKAQADAFLR